jgi:hypothetical protein
MQQGIGVAFAATEGRRTRMMDEQSDRAEEDDEMLALSGPE